MTFTIKELERVLVVARIFEHGLPEPVYPMVPHVVQMYDTIDDEIIFTTVSGAETLTVDSDQFKRGISAIQIFDEAKQNKGD